MSEQVYKYKSTRNVDWKRIPKVEGVVVSRGSHEVEGEQREFLVIDSGPILYRVYKATDLDELFKAAKSGDGISIEFVETVQLKKAGRRLNRFAASLWTVPKAE